LLDLDLTRPAAPPRDAATVLVVRDANGGIETFCVKRHLKSGFLGGAVVFPGGKVDDDDRSDAWAEMTTLAPVFADEDAATARAFGVAACREALEEAALLLAVGALPTHTELLLLRASLARREISFREALVQRGLTLDLAALRPFARWVTPVAEARRFDTRFFLASAPAGQDGAHDDHETTASFWASPSEVLRRWSQGEVQLAPPTHRSLELLTGAASSREAALIAEGSCKDAICPKLVPVDEPGGGTVALVLPGDPEHAVATPRVAGHGRFVLREGRWLPEASPRR
jgi:8-oxo-dGTP pyrophosphatase MutT (NUDIX family)